MKIGIAETNQCGSVVLPYRSLDGFVGNIEKIFHFLTVPQE